MMLRRRRDADRRAQVAAVARSMQDALRPPFLTAADVATKPGCGYVRIDFGGRLLVMGPVRSRVGRSANGRAWITGDGQVLPVQPTGGLPWAYVANDGDGLTVYVPDEHAQYIELLNDIPPAEWIAATPGPVPPAEQPHGIYATAGAVQ